MASPGFDDDTNAPTPDARDTDAPAERSASARKSRTLDADQTKATPHNNCYDCRGLIV